MKTDLNHPLKERGIRQKIKQKKLKPHVTSFSLPPALLKNDIYMFRR
jgi:hypothetical protein